VIREVIRRHEGNLTRAARELGISRHWLRRLLKGRAVKKKKH
jgi:DNA-binding NtrC family response regulator